MSKVQDKIKEDEAVIAAAQAQLAADLLAAEAVALAAAVAPKAVRTAEDVTHWTFDNEQPDVVHCTLTFRDGTTASATAPHTGDLGADQQVASAAALAA